MSRRTRIALAAAVAALSLAVAAVPAAVAAPVPATLSLSVGAEPSFGEFIPGVARDYEASTSANVIHTVPSATLTVHDPSSVATGHLVNGTFFLPQLLQARATSAAGTGTAFAAVGGSASPTPVLTYNAPASNDAVTLSFRQRINANDALRFGTYAKQVTFTLSTTTPCTMSTTVTLNVNGVGSSSAGPVRCGPTIANLIESVEDFNLSSKIEGNLLKKLTGAQKDLDADNLAGACDKLAAFIAGVQAQRGKKIATAEANALIAQAEEVRAAEGCD
jgi:opacity protein-like surface antigen